MTTSGELFINDYGNRKIRKVDPNGIITAIAGLGVGGFGSALNAVLRNAGEVVVTDDGDVLFADTFNNRIRKVYASDGTIATVAGSGYFGFSGDGGLATAAALSQPRSVAYKDGEVYIADTENHRVRKILNDGTITTIAGSGIGDYCGDYGLAKCLPQSSSEYRGQQCWRNIYFRGG